jgi:uncharacterized protein YggE
MRTTLTLDDDAAQLATTYAKANDLRLGEAVSQLIRRAHAKPMPIKRKGEVWVVDAPADTPRMTPDRVKQLLEDWP